MNKNAEIAKRLKEDLIAISTEITETNLIERIESAKRSIQWAELFLTKSDSILFSNTEKEIDESLEQKEKPSSKQESFDLSDSEEAFKEVIKKENPWTEKCLVVEEIKGFRILDYEGKERLYMGESVARRHSIVDGMYIRLTKIEKATERAFPYAIECMGVKEGYVSRFKRITNMVIKESEDGKKRAVKIDSVDDVHWDVSDSFLESKGIKVGEVIDIKVDRDNPHIKQLAWKHMFNEEIVNLKKKDNGPKAKSNLSSADISQEDPILRIDGIEGKTVLLVGLSCKEAECKKIVEESRGTLISVDKKSIKPSEMKALVRKSDVVVMAKNSVSHSQTTLAVKFAKNFGKKFDSFNGFSQNGFTTAVVEALKK